MNPPRIVITNSDRKTTLWKISLAPSKSFFKDLHVLVRQLQISKPVRHYDCYLAMADSALKLGYCVPDIRRRYT
jgi:hypothetical protein